jgi:hypothetical protein
MRSNERAGRVGHVPNLLLVLFLILTTLVFPSPFVPSLGVRLSTSRPANAATKSAPSSGKLSLMSTALTPQAPSTATRTYSSSASTSISTRPLADAMSPVPCLLTWSQAPWTLSAPAPSDSSSAQTTSSLDRLEQVTTGPRDTTLRALS